MLLSTIVVNLVSSEDYDGLVSFAEENTNKKLYGISPIVSDAASFSNFAFLLDSCCFSNIANGLCRCFAGNAKCEAAKLNFTPPNCLFEFLNGMYGTVDVRVANVVPVSVSYVENYDFSNPDMRLYYYAWLHSILRYSYNHSDEYKKQNLKNAIHSMNTVNELGFSENKEAQIIETFVGDYDSHRLSYVLCMCNL